MDRREYQVGRFTLQPFRQLLESGESVAVKPKALAILSVLAEADGALVTKDEIMAAVWPQLIVEDNAVQAHVASLRKILGRDAELLCTVHGLGYRLQRTETAPEAAPAPPGAAGAGRRHVPRALWAAASLACAAALGLWLLPNSLSRAPSPPAAQIAVLPFERSASGVNIEMMAGDLQHKIAAALTDAGILLASGTDGEFLQSSASQPGNGNSEFLLSGRINAAGDAYEVQVRLSDAAENVTIWSATLQANTAASGTLITRVATEVANAAHFAVIGRTGNVRLDAAGVAAFVAARNSISGAGRSTPALTIENHKKVISAAPDFTWGHSGLAAAYAFLLRNSRENEVLRNEARALAHHALELSSDNGEAYLALELLAPRFEWKEREDLLLKGFEADPDFEPTSMHEGRLLWSIGLSHDALPWFRRAYNTDPLHNDNTFSYAASLASEGHPVESRKLVAHMEIAWPEQVSTKNARFWTSVISGSTAETLNILADDAKWPPGMNRKSAETWRLALTALTSEDPASRSRALDAIRSTARDGSLDHGEALLLFAMLNDIDAAFGEAEVYEPTDPRWGPFLFLGATQGMRSDQRFMRLAVRFGFAAYWRSTGRWPDFCTSPHLPYDCKAEIAKLAVGDPGLAPITARPLMATN